MRSDRHVIPDDTERSPLRRVLYVVFYPVMLVVQLGLMAIFVASFAPLLSDILPVLAALESFTVLLVAAGVVFTLAGLLFRPRWLALLGVASLIWNALQLWPYVPMHMIPGIGALQAMADTGANSSTVVPPDGAPKLKVVSANLWYRNDSYDAALSYFEASHADVIGIVEITPQGAATLAPLYQDYPYRVDCMDRTPPCEIMLLSKYPFVKSYAGRIDGRTPTIVWGEIAFQGRTITVAETHFTWPLLPAVSNADATVAGTLQPPPLLDSDPLAQSQQARNLAQYLSGLGPDLVLMGDFNSVPWSRTQSAFRRATGLDNVGPIVPTWPVWDPFWLRLPIDHIFVRGALQRVAFRSGNYVGSDHLPVEAEIALTAR